MSKIMVFGDFKADKIKNLNLDGALVKLLNESDINIVNFEGPIKTMSSPIYKSGPNIYQHIESPDFLEELGFNVISLANNHSFDFGLEGFQQTKQAFKKAFCVGAGDVEQAYSEFKFICNDGLRIGILSATQDEFGTFSQNYKNALGCASLYSCKFRESVRKLSLDPEIDFVLILSHAGMENVDYPLPEIRDIYKELIDLGADAVIATHPHVVQGVEIYKNKPIAYSLGNFCFQTTNSKKIHSDKWNESISIILDISLPHNANYKIVPLKYLPSEGMITFNSSSKFEEHFEQLNKKLSENSLYEKEVDKIVLNAYPNYMGLFSRSGLFSSKFGIHTIKGFYEMLRNKFRWNKTHLLNNLQCDSHRWAIIRALRIKGKIKY